MAKFDKMARFIPGLYRPEINPNIRGLLFSWSTSDDEIVQQAQNAKDQIFVKLANLSFLDSLGSNVGVFRPTEFNLADAQYRELIPTLSFRPKQVRTTIQRVLDVFFEAGNPAVTINEVNPNEIVIQIPSSVPSLRRSLRGSQHFHAYSGTIVSVDNVLKEMVVDLENSTKILEVDELANARIGQIEDIQEDIILSNTAGNLGVTLQFSAVTDLSHFTATNRFRMWLPKYPGGFLHNPDAGFTLTKQRGKINQAIDAGTIYPVLTMEDASGIPDAIGNLIFSFGRDGQEGLIKYFGRPNNTTLLLDPAYTFTKSHAVGDVVNVAVTPVQSPNVNGTDYSIYLVGVTAARFLAQEIVESIVAAGVIVRWIVVTPEC